MSPQHSEWIAAPHVQYCPHLWCGLISALLFYSTPVCTFLTACLGQEHATTCVRGIGGWLGPYGPCWVDRIGWYQVSSLQKKRSVVASSIIPESRVVSKQKKPRASSVTDAKDGLHRRPQNGYKVIRRHLTVHSRLPLRDNLIPQRLVKRTGVPHQARTCSCALV